MSKISRKDFIHISGLSLSGTLIGFQTIYLEGNKGQNNNTTIQEIINLMTEAIEGEPLRRTVDTLKIGDPSQRCTGIVSTFLATADIIQKTADLGANFIITHEPTFYNHLDEVDWLEGDKVYQFKRELLEKNNITVWRYHDYWHRHKPDGILQGFLESIGWEKYLKITRRNTGICNVPKISLKNLAGYFKETLNLKRPFIIGNPNQECTKIGLLPGSWGPRSQMGMLRDDDIEVLVVGEVAEWETSEYVRDAAYAGMKKGLIILGHAPSEAPGMEYLVGWLKPKLPGIPIYYENTTDAFIPV
ncbi:MAG: Nif3-like dinuclear metal center hexameric protein [Balneolales bacterium]